MKSTVTVVRVLLGLTGAALVVLGILFWTGHALSLTPLHLLLGALFVLALWASAVLGFYARAGAGLALLALGWGVLVALLGVYQLRLLPGPQHWIVRWLHLLVGVAAIGLGQLLVKRTRARTAILPPA